MALSVSETEKYRLQTRRIANTVRLGFAFVLGLTFVLGSLGMYQLTGLNQQAAGSLLGHSTRSELVHQMRDAIRLRTVALLKMVTSDDYFVRDEQLLLLYQYAGMYREARDKFNEYEHEYSEKELELYQNITDITRKSQPAVRGAAQMLLQDPLPPDYQQQIQKALRLQDLLLSKLDTAILLQKLHGERQLAGLREQGLNTLMMLSGASAVLLVIGLVAAGVTTRFVKRWEKALLRKNEQLLKANEKVEAANQAKSNFLANMSHEMRTPLTSIIGFSEMLLNPESDQREVPTLVKSIYHSGVHLHQIINDILDISRIEAGQFHLEKSDCVLTELVADVFAVFSESADKKDLDVSLQYDLPVPRVMHSDANRLRQILLNLCNNAVKFTEAGAVSFRVAYIAEHNNIIFTVKDTGIGITRERIEHIFAPFEQGDNSPSRRYGGTGLGLTISLRLAQQLGARLHCNSEPGKGSEFVLELPSGVRDPVMLTAEPRQDATPAHNFEASRYRARVLLAEDTHETQLLLGLHLRRAGAEAVVVANGLDAVHAAFDQHFDLILMDIQMPLMDGLEAIRCLRKGGCKVPIVCVTANALKEDRDQCLQSGADDYIGKPIDFVRFHEVLNRYLPKADPSDAQVSTTPVYVSPRVELSNRRPEHDEALWEITQQFLGNLPGMMLIIEQCATNLEWKGLERESHRLKGMGGSFGFDELTEIAKHILNCARSKSVDGLQEYVEALRLQVDELMVQVPLAQSGASSG